MISHPIPTTPHSSRNHQAVNPSRESNDLYVSTSLTTPQSTMVLPVTDGYLLSPYINDSSTMMERTDNRKQASVADLSQHQHFFTSPTGMPQAGSGSITTVDESRHQVSSVRSVSRTGRDDSSRGGRLGDDDSYDDFSAKVRSEMRKVQSDMMGVVGGRGAGGNPFRQELQPCLSNGGPSSAPLRSDPSYRPTVVAAAPSSARAQVDRYHDEPAIKTSRGRDAKGTHVNTPGEIRNNENEKRRASEEYYKLIERNKKLERELAAKDSEIVSLHSERLGGEQDHRQVKGRNMQLEERNKDLEKKLTEKESKIEELEKEMKEVTRQLQYTKEATQTTTHSSEYEKARLAKTYARDLDALESEFEQALDEAVRENESLQKELATSRGVVGELQDKADELHQLRNENEVLRMENEKIKEMADIAEEDMALRERTMNEMEQDWETALREKERDYDDAMAEKNRLENEVAGLKELEVEYEKVVKEKRDLEPAGEELNKLKIDYAVLETENMHIEENYHHLLEEKIRHERANEEIQEEFCCMREDYEDMKERVGLLDEMTEALEIALEEKQSALAEKEELILACDQLQDECKTLQRTIARSNDSMVQEVNAAVASKEAALNATLASKEAELNAALAAKEEAITQFKNMVKEHTMLTKEHTKVLSTKDSAAHVAEITTRQRDKMGELVEKMQGEILELKSANRDLCEQRDDLKEELICVLETASVYRGD
mmetsp:Transcript_10861/g.23036  ORF Transcript_10861/g.23036 Transcript_10861/m.23036 type:complete len:721 (-) Transcript_10861:108-2270(-)